MLHGLQQVAVIQHQSDAPQLLVQHFLHGGVVLSGADRRKGVLRGDIQGAAGHNVPGLPAADRQHPVPVRPGEHHQVQKHLQVQAVQQV